MNRLSTRLFLGGTGSLGALVAYRYGSIVQKDSRLPSEPLDPFAKLQVNKKPKNDKQRILIIGGGVVGVTTAYKLALRGHSVALLEPRPDPGEECSACAAGGMQKSNPVVDKDTWIAVLKCIFPKTTQLVFGGEEEPFKFFHIDFLSSLSDPFFLRWALTFTQTSLFPDSHQHDKQVEMLKFTKYAVNDMITMMEDRKDNMKTQSGYNARGSVAVSYDPVGIKGDPLWVEPQEDDPGKDAGSPASTKMSYEPHRKIVGAKLFEKEPSLKWFTTPPTSAKFEFESNSANSERFTKELARRCVTDPKLDVIFEYETTVKAVTTKETGDKPRISEIHTNRGVIEVAEDTKVVVAAGAWTPHVMALMDLYAPVYPLKGYALTVSAQEALKANPKLKNEDLPSRIVSDKYVYTTRLGDDIRITSIGEFSEWDTTPTPHVDAEFRRASIERMPQIKEFIDKAPTRCGFRPFVSDGLLLLGTVDTHENLFVSCGPGSNGWKLAMGSGEIIERLVVGQTTDQIAQELGFDANAFSPAGRVLKAPLFAKLCRARWNV